MATEALALTDYLLGRGQLDELARFLQLYKSHVPPAALRHVHSTMDALGIDYEHVPDRETLQRARNHLLVVRELLGDYYDEIPVPDKLIRYCDNALLATPGEDEPSQVPYG